MSPADLTATLATLHAAGVRWTITGGGVLVPGSKPGVVIGDEAIALLATLRPHRATLATLAHTGRCPGCERFAMPPLQVCYWCQRGAMRAAQRVTASNPRTYRAET
jgi:hypothetical protein